MGRDWEAERALDGRRVMPTYVFREHTIKHTGVFGGWVG